MSVTTHQRDIRYIGTRKDTSECTFRDVQLQSMAPDNGLYVPTHLPHYNLAQIRAWSNLSYAELATNIVAPFTNQDLTHKHLADICEAGYLKDFGVSELAPLRPLKQSKHEEYILELFHGPTLSFKDYALQISGRLLDTMLGNNARALVLGATSGDTGSAAIAGYKGLDNIEIVILHPHKRVSEIQRRQMTTEHAKNVHNLAITGDYDVCQKIVKNCLNNQSLTSSKCVQVTVNSINWARIMMQIVYYFSAFLKVGAPANGVYFCVPTGNFGNIYAGYLARGMGLPIRRLIAGVNPNSVLPNFYDTGVYPYRTQPTIKTLAPSMDIAVPSNFERLLFDLVERDGNLLAAKLSEWQDKKSMKIEARGMEKLRDIFAFRSVDDDALCDTIAQIHRDEDGYILDPHSASAIVAGRDWIKNSGAHAEAPLIYIATADPVKFPQAIERALNLTPKMNDKVRALMNNSERYETLEANEQAVQEYLIKLGI